MKFITISSTKLSHKVHLSLFTAVFALTVPMYGFYSPDKPRNVQSKIQEPRERAISLKLPLLQPTFHWTFMSREDFLSGKLLLRIIRDGQVSEIIIFEKGQFTDGWEAMPLPPPPDRGEIYFGFISTRKYLTAPSDELELELTVIKDLPGIGATETGILPAGKYTSKGTYSDLIDEYDTTFLAEELAKEGKRPPDEQKKLLNKIREMYGHKAFLESWTSQWPLKITDEKGWLPDQQASALKSYMLKNLNTQVKPIVAPPDSAVTNEKFFQKYLWFWIIIPLIVLLAVVSVRRIFAKP